MSKVWLTARGVTLLELMIALAAICILAVFALPSYKEYLDRAGRSEARALLLEIATNQERFYLTARRFGSLSELGYADPLVSDSGNYNLSMPIHSTTRFVATASYTGGGDEQDRCTSLSVNNFGERTSRGTFRNCWNDRR